ncbi:BTB/POZ protein [Daldinia decipiens]|uniref:BTB/POZ protein n=1 Tax=Daldinia decipiens TaxID=326647 RepID=UPI0020C24AD3|nr:BTB/POZ protein [Daldinia decipiens]KAI1659329.1 BTB/POZ protein [Daldinia decipiens]
MSSYSDDASRSSSSSDGAFRDSFGNRADRITLQVGERRFTTLRETLIESEYFAARLSGRWNDADEDGSYFVDANPVLFEHILSYLRSGNFPVFFDSNTLTFDHAKYLSLLGDARYFGIRKLIEWIERKKYLGVVEITRSVIVDDDVNSVSMHSHMSGVPGDSKVDLTTSWGFNKIYVCPRNLHFHPTSSTCGCDLAKRREEGDKFRDELVLRAVVTITTATFNPNCCLGHGGID